MEQYSNLNVHGKITQKAAQGTTSDDIVKYPTLTDRVPATLPTPAVENEGKAIISNGTGFEFGEAGKVDEIQINSTKIAPTVDGQGHITSKVANILTSDGIISSSNTIKPNLKSYTNSSLQSASTASPTVSRQFAVTKDTDGYLSVNVPYPDYEVKVSNGLTVSQGGSGGGSGGSGGSGTTSQISKTTFTVAPDLASTSLSSQASAAITETSGRQYAVNLDSNKKLSVNVPWTDHVTTATDSGSGNVVTGVSANNGALTITKGIGYTTTADPSKIVQRKSDGQITVPESPDADTDAASKKFVNSSISNNTAKFLGTYEAAGTGAKALGIAQATVDAFTYVPDSTMESTTASAIATKLSGQTVSNLDYVFVAVNKSTTTVPSTVDWFWRFKATVSGSTTTWEYEFTLNNSSFTQAQWNAINSGIEASDVTKLDGIEPGAEVNVQADWNQTNTGADDYIKNKPELSVATTGSGNAVTAIAVDSTNKHKLNVTKGSTFLTSHQTIKQDGITGATINRYGACSTAAATAAKTVSITSGTFPTLNADANGTKITVNFANANTATSAPTLNVNSKGAKNIYYRGAQVTATTNTVALKGPCDFIYDNSTGWHLVGNNSVEATEVTLADM